MLDFSVTFKKICDVTCGGFCAFFLSRRQLVLAKFQLHENVFHGLLQCCLLVNENFYSSCTHVSCKSKRAMAECTL